MWPRRARQDGSKPEPLSRWPRYPGGAIAGAVVAIVGTLVFLFNFPELRHFLSVVRLFVVALWLLWVLEVFRSDG